MVGVVAVLVVVTISVVVFNVGAVALVATGVSRDLAHFQARSAFTGVGYTTAEAETITGHTVRRRIILTLMLLGNAGIVSVIASLVSGSLTPVPRRWRVWVCSSAVWGCCGCLRPRTCSTA